MDGWLSPEDVAASLIREAEASARQLGHWLTGRWVHVGDRWFNRCIECLEQVIVHPRAFSEQRVRGLVVQFRCAPQRRKA